MNILQGFGWAHRRPKSFEGIGNGRVETMGKRMPPTALWLLDSGNILLGFLESHEQRANHPLLSGEAQARMGFVKDMREGRI